MAFLWGIIRLIKAQPLPETYGLEDPSGGNNSDWGFGQVVALVLLVAPFITLAEYFCNVEFCNALRFWSMLNSPRSASGQDTKHNMRNDPASDETRCSLPQTKGTNNFHARVSTAISGGFGDFEFDLDPDHLDNAWQHRPRTFGAWYGFCHSFLCFPVHCFGGISYSLQFEALAAVGSIFVGGGGPFAIAALFLLIMIFGENWATDQPGSDKHRNCHFAIHIHKAHRHLLLLFPAFCFDTLYRGLRFVSLFE